jgi:hypothetical protein
MHNNKKTTTTYNFLVNDIEPFFHFQLKLKKLVQYLLILTDMFKTYYNKNICRLILK